MPTRIRTLHSRARSAQLGDAIEAALNFVNVGEGAYGEYIFDVKVPEQAPIQAAVNAVLDDLYTAAHAIGAEGAALPDIRWRLAFERLRPFPETFHRTIELATNQEPDAIRLGIAECEQQIAVLTRARNAVAILELWSNI